MLHREMGDVDDRWTLGPAEHALLANKSGITRLGFAVLLKMFQVEGRFPRQIEEVPTAAVEAIARQLGLLAIIWPSYDWNGRTMPITVPRSAVPSAFAKPRPMTPRP